VGAGAEGEDRARADGIFIQRDVHLVGGAELGEGLLAGEDLLSAKLDAGATTRPERMVERLPRQRGADTKQAVVPLLLEEIDGRILVNGEDAHLLAAQADPAPPALAEAPADRHLAAVAHLVEVAVLAGPV